MAVVNGFECEFVEKPPKAVQSECPICLLVLRESYQATCCGKSFCKECIERSKAGTKRCPTCKTDNFFSYPNKGLQQSLNDFEVYCSHKSKGCEWRGELRELDKHLNSDPPADKSLEGCLFTVISCPLSHTGCEVKLPRRDVKIHVNDDLLGHLVKQTALVTELKEKIENLEDVLRNTGHRIGPVEITMTNFKRYQDDDEQWPSPPFYTHLHGYNMCLCVWPKGFDHGKGTHLGVTVHLMGGEFDDQLKWPFRGDITVQLVDQEEDEDHVAMVVPFNDLIPDRVTKRVTKGKRNSSGRGSSKLRPLSNLQPKYLKNDCIKFRIVKVVLPQ